MVTQLRWQIQPRVPSIVGYNDREFYHRNTQRRCNRLHPRSGYHRWLTKCSLWNAISQVCHWPHALVPQAQHFQSPPSEPYWASRISEYKCMPLKCSKTVQSSHINSTFRRSNTAKNHGEAGKSPGEERIQQCCQWCRKKAGKTVFQMVAMSSKTAQRQNYRGSLMGNVLACNHPQLHKTWYWTNAKRWLVQDFKA